MVGVESGFFDKNMYPEIWLFQKPKRIKNCQAPTSTTITFTIGHTNVAFLDTLRPVKDLDHLGNDNQNTIKFWNLPCHPFFSTCNVGQQPAWTSN